MKPTKSQLETLSQDLLRLKNEGGLNPLRQSVLQQQLLARLTTPGETVPLSKRYLWVERKFNLMKFIVTTVLTLMLSGGTVLASQTSLPGDTLYPVKRLAEKVELVLITSEKSKAEVEASHASERLTELNKLKAKAAVEVKAEDKANVEQHEQEARIVTQNEVSSTLNLLHDLQVKLETDGRVEDAAKLKNILGELSQKASQSEFKVDIEENGRFRLNLTEPARDSSFRNREERKGDDGENERQNSETKGATDLSGTVIIRGGDKTNDFERDEEGSENELEDEDDNKIPVTNPTPTPVPNPNPVTVPAPTGYTTAQVKTHATLASCWTAVNNNVYNLTPWISAHPGGSQAILGLCGTNGSAAFNAQHGSQAKTNNALASFRIGALIK